MGIEQAPPPIAVEDVTYSYDETPAIEDISLSVDTGEFFGLIGPNGSGKTTLMKLMLGLLEPDQGDISLFGEPATEFADGTRLAYVSQQSTEAKDRVPVTVREVVRMGRYPHVGLNELSEEDQRLLDTAIETVGIEDLAERRIGKLSGGQKQRAFIARALAAEADLLALDEPMVGVDAEARSRFYSLLDTLRDDGITIVLIDHDIEELLTHADRLALINRQVEYVGDTSSFLESDVLLETYGAPGATLRMMG